MKYLIFLFIPSLAFAKLNVAATTTDLAALVREVGGAQVDVFSVAKGTQDPHQVEAKPSFMIKFRDVDLVIAHGLELESAWLEPLIRGSRNPKLQEKNRVLELAGELQPLEIPKGALSRAEGDVHPGGNPHFQLDPVRLGQAAVLIGDRLSELDPSQKTLFATNAKAFQKKMEDRVKDWSARIKASGVKEAVTYHKTFTYFCDRFGIQCSVQLEPKPGIPPTASHLVDVLDQMKKRKIDLVLIENLYEDTVGAKLREGIPSVKVHRVAVSVDGAPGLETNEKLIEALVKTVEGKAP